MWIVENTLRATLTLRGLGVSIPPGEQLDLDVLGRERAESSNQVQVAFEEGYLRNVRKEPTVDADPPAADDPPAAGEAPLTDDPETLGPPAGDPELEIGPAHGARLEAFRREVLAELRNLLPDLGEPRDPSEHDVQQLVGELKLIRERFLSFSERVQLDSSLDPDEVDARLALLDVEERKLLDAYGVAGPEDV